MKPTLPLKNAVKFNHSLVTRKNRTQGSKEIQRNICDPQVCGIK
jgi:hypothetical protein